MLVDLQVHSTHSDGYLSPKELADMLSKKGVRAAALTDHNTTRGTDSFQRACESYGITTVTGIELYTYIGHHTFNVLWYGFDHTDSALQETLRQSHLRRKRLMSAALHRMEKHGFRINIEKILGTEPDYISLNHTIDAILATPYNVRLIKKELDIHRPPEETEVIRAYLHNKHIGKLRNSLIRFHRIAELKKKCGGYLILCHPGKDRDPQTLDVHFWKRLKNMGLDGVETLSPHHSFEAIVRIQHMARELGFIETGGSDFHNNTKNIAIERSWDYFSIDARFLNGIEKILGT